MKTISQKRFAPVFAGWGKERAVSDHRDTDFVEADTTYETHEEAMKHAEQGRRNYPHETTGKAIPVLVTIKPLRK